MENTATRKTVLIVDDEPLSVSILCHQLENEYTTVIAQSGSEALDIIAITPPDIILLDLLMPGMDGYEVYGAIRKLPALDGVPVLFITALPDVECEAMGLEMGANDYVHKPFVPDLVRLRIKNHLLFSQERSLLLKRSAELQEVNLRLEEEISRRTATQKTNEELIARLEASLAQVKLLEGIIPICSYCHNIRDSKDSWSKLEQYIGEHSEAQFSHGICPDCFQKQMSLVKEMA